MLSRLKRAIGPSIDEEDEEEDSTDPEVVKFRLSYRSFVDDNGWETLDSWKTSELGPWEDVPVTREELKARMDHEWPPGHYILFPVDEHGRLQSAEWSIKHGTEETARMRKKLQEDRQSQGDQGDSGGGSITITPEMMNRMQQAMDNIDWPDDEAR